MHRLFFVLILLIATNGFAADVTHLYQSEKSVSSQNEAERRTASANILQHVLLKVVGDSELLDKTDISDILAQSDQLIQQYEYRRTNIIADDLTEPDRLEVVLSFNPSGVNTALKNAGLPIWGASRPETLIWLAVEKGDDRAVVSADEQTGLTHALAIAAQTRGLPILFPVMDLQDQSQVTFADLSAGFSQTIEAASQRYGSPVTLLVFAKVNADGSVQVRWNMLINGESEHWQSRGNRPDAMKIGMDELANRLARQFSQRIAESEQSNKLALQVGGVNDYQDYVRVVNYLNQIQYVSEVQVTNLAAESLELSVEFVGDIRVFNRIVAVDRILMEEPYSPTDTINYRLLP